MEVHKEEHEKTRQVRCLVIIGRVVRVDTPPHGTFGDLYVDILPMAFKPGFHERVEIKFIY